MAKKHREIDTKRIIFSLLWFIIIAIAIWSVLFHIAEWWNYFDSLYFTVITFSTIWYGDVIPVTHVGKIIAMVYAILWVPLFVWITSVVMELRFKKFVFHNFEHHTKSFKKADAELRKELVEEELRNLQQEKEIKKIEKEIKNKTKKDWMISKIMRKIKLKK